MAYSILFAPANDRPFEAERTFETLEEAVTCVMAYTAERHAEYPDECPRHDFRCWSCSSDTDMVYTASNGDVWTVSPVHPPVDE